MINHRNWPCWPPTLPPPKITTTSIIQPWQLHHQSIPCIPWNFKSALHNTPTHLDNLPLYLGTTTPLSWTLTAISTPQPHTIQTNMWCQQPCPTHGPQVFQYTCDTSNILQQNINYWTMSTPHGKWPCHPRWHQPTKSQKYSSKMTKNVKNSPLTHGLQHYTNPSSHTGTGLCKWVPKPQNTTIPPCYSMLNQWLAKTTYANPPTKPTVSNNIRHDIPNALSAMRHKTNATNTWTTYLLWPIIPKTKPIRNLFLDSNRPRKIGGALHLYTQNSNLKPVDSPIYSSQTLKTHRHGKGSQTSPHWTST